METDAISRIAVLAVGNVRKVVEYDEAGYSIEYLAVPVDVIKEIPALDVAPVVHARWVDPEGIHEYHCSRCDGIAPNDGYDSGAAYCDECGARMDERVEKGE